MLGSFSIGTDPTSNRLTNWIVQYVTHMATNNPVGSTVRNAKPFNFNGNKAYNHSFTITIAELDAMIFKSASEYGLRVFANRWDRALEANVRYRKEENGKNWQDWVTAQQAVVLLTISSG
jgi:hypothetical protein